MEHFPEQSEALLQSLDLAHRRTLQGELCLSSSSSSGSLAQVGNLGQALRTPQKSKPVSQLSSGKRIVMKKLLVNFIMIIFLMLLVKELVARKI